MKLDKNDILSQTKFEEGYDSVKEFRVYDVTKKDCVVNSTIELHYYLCNKQL